MNKLGRSCKTTQHTLQKLSQGAVDLNEILGHAAVGNYRLRDLIESLREAVQIASTSPLHSKVAQVRGMFYDIAMTAFREANYYKALGKQARLMAKLCVQLDKSFPNGSKTDTGSSYKFDIHWKEP